MRFSIRSSAVVALMVSSVLAAACGSSLTEPGLVQPRDCSDCVRPTQAPTPSVAVPAQSPASSASTAILGAVTNPFGSPVFGWSTAPFAPQPTTPFAPPSTTPFPPPSSTPFPPPSTTPFPAPPTTPFGPKP